MKRSPDHELIVLARKGSSQAAEALFDRYWTHAWRAAYAVTGDRSLADDAAQEAIEKAFGALDRFDETRPFAPWLKRIAVNRAVDHLRRARRVETLAGGVAREVGQTSGVGPRRARSPGRDGARGRCGRSAAHTGSDLG